MTEVFNAPVFAGCTAVQFSDGPPQENFDLDIPKHKIVSVFGPNGWGKSLKDTKIGCVFPNYREAMFPWMRAKKHSLDIFQREVRR